MKIHVDDFPFILAGPMLRRVTSHSASVFLALKEPRWVQLKLYDDPDTFPGGVFADTPIAWHPGFEYPLCPTIRLGAHLHVVVATVTIPEWFDDGSADGLSIEGMVPGRTYGYNTFFHTTPTDGGESISLAQTAFHLLTTDNPNRLGFEPGRLPSFSLPPGDFGKLNIVHGSCRKPHGEGTDMLTKLDDILAHDTLYRNPDKRPHLMVLTGDQIYADDVDPLLLWLLHHAGRTLLGWEEVFPGTDQNTGALREILTTLSDTARAVANTVEGQPMPDLSGSLAQAMGNIEDTRPGRTVKQQLTAFSETLETLLSAAQGAVTGEIREVAIEMAGWLDKHREIFANLSSHHPWGQAGVPRTDGNAAFINNLRSELESIPEPVPEAMAAAVAGQLAANLNPDLHPGITGHFFKDRLRDLSVRASQLAGSDPVDETAVTGLVGELKAWTEEDTAFEYIASRISPPQRSKELKQFSALTSDAMASHLMFLGEFYMMYLFTWSDAMWPRDGVARPRMPEFFEAVPNYGLTGALSKTSLEKSREKLIAFAGGVSKVRRVLANIPTLMMFDDHEVTDDWNLNLDWVASVNRSVMGPQLLRNALCAYAVFQDWGNQPEDYADNVSVAGRRILEAITMPEPSLSPDPAPDPPTPPVPPPMVDPGDPDTRSVINLLLGIGPEIAAQLPQVSLDSLPTALVGTTDGDYAVVKPDGRKIWDWTYQPYPGSPFKVISLDTRNHRGFPTRLWAARANLPITTGFPDGPQIGGYVAAANLIQPDELTRQLIDRFQDGMLHLVVSPAPVFGLPLVEDLFQRLSALSSGPEVSDFEAWQGNPDGFQRLADAMLGHDIVLLSGDVHYAYSNILTVHTPGGGTPPQPIMQLCASSFKNETGLTRLIGQVGREGRIVDWFRLSNFPETMETLWEDIKAFPEEIEEGLAGTLGNLLNFSLWFDETAPMINPLNPGSYVTYYLAMKDTLLLDIDMLTPRGLFSIGGSTVRYVFIDMIARSFDPDTQEGVYVHEGRELRFLADSRDHAARLLRAGQLNPADALDALDEPEFKLKQQPEVVGFNNFGRVSFSPDTSAPPLERVSHELFWMTHDRRGKPQKEGAILAGTIHGYVPKIVSFREEIVRVARAEHLRWNPETGVRITENDPEGIAILEEYHLLLKSENAGRPALIGFYGPRGGVEEGEILHWSATFISYVLKVAGAGDRFFYSTRHIDYIRWAKYHRVNDTDNPFYLYERTDAEAIPEPGDLVVLSHDDQPFTYDTVQAVEYSESPQPAHVDIVVAVSGASVDAIGGNVSHRVKKRTFPLENNRLEANSPDAPGDTVIGLIKIREAP